VAVGIDFPVKSTSTSTGCDWNDGDVLHSNVWSPYSWRHQPGGDHRADDCGQFYGEIRLYVAAQLVGAITAGVRGPSDRPPIDPGSTGSDPKR